MRSRVCNTHIVRFIEPSRVRYTYSAMHNAVFIMQNIDSGVQPSLLSGILSRELELLLAPHSMTIVMAATGANPRVVCGLVHGGTEPTHLACTFVVLMRIHRFMYQPCNCRCDNLVIKP